MNFLGSSQISQKETMGLSTSSRLLAAAKMAKRISQPTSATCAEHLDIGSGHGDLIALLRKTKLITNSCACDFIDKLMKLPNVKVHEVELNQQPLPFADNSFDLVTGRTIVLGCFKAR